MQEGEGLARGLYDSYMCRAGVDIMCSYVQARASEGMWKAGSLVMRLMWGIFS